MPSSRFLDPIDRTLEILFGLIMVVVVTASIDTAQAGSESVDEMLVAAVGCNVAWGIVDAVMYLLANFAARARGLVMLKAIRVSPEPATAQRLIAEGLPSGLSAMLGAPELESLRRRLTAISNIPHASLTRDDCMGAAGVFLLVFLSTFPIVIPFLLMQHVTQALRASQAVAAIMLFLIGWSLGVNTGRTGWRTGLFMVGIGAVLSAVTFVLGG